MSMSGRRRLPETGQQQQQQLQQRVSRKLQTLVAHAEGVTCVRIGPRSGQVLASGGEDGKLNLWKIGRPGCLQSIQVAKRAVQCVAFDAEESVAAVGSRSGNVKLLALNAGGKTRCRLTGHRTECTTTTFHPLGNVLGSGGQDTDVKVWDIRTKGCVRTFADHDDTVSCLAFSPDGKWVASGSEDRTVKLWDLQAGKLLHEFVGHRGGISAVRFHPDEFWLATGSKDGTVRYWDLETFRQVGSTPTEHGQAIRQIGFLDTAARLGDAAPHNLVCASDHGVRVWSLQPTRGISAEPVAWGRVQDAHIARDKQEDQRLIACALKDRTMVTVWSVDMTAMVQDDDLDCRSDVSVEELVGDNVIVRAPRPARLGGGDEAAPSPSRDRNELCSGRAQDPETPDQQVSRAVDAGHARAKEVVKDASDPESRPSARNNRNDSWKGPKSGRQGHIEISPTANEGKSACEQDGQPPGKVEKEHCAGVEDNLTVMEDYTSDEDFEAQNESIWGPGDDKPGPPPVSGRRESPGRSREEASFATSEAQDPEDSQGSEAGGSKRREPRARKPPRSRVQKPEQENAKPNRERRLVSQWAAHDGPLDISYSDFSRGAWSASRKAVESRTVRADAKVHVTEEVMKEHAKFRTIMQERAEELDRVLAAWRDNEPTRALESLEALGNPSIAYDFFRCVNFRNGRSATLDICAAALPALASLGESQFEVHIKSLLATGKFLFDSFGAMISATLDHHRRHRRQSTRSNVDISREERVHKCRRCARGFRVLVGLLDKLLASGAMESMARTKAEATNLHAKIEKFLAEINPVTPGHPSPPGVPRLSLGADSAGAPVT